MADDQIKATMLPWAESTEDKKRLWLLVAGFFFGSLLLLFLLNSITYPEIDRTKAEKIPERIAKMILEKEKETPPPPPPPPLEEDVTEGMDPLVEPEPEPAPEPEPEPAPLPDLEPETEVAPVEDIKPVEVAKPVEKLKKKDQEVAKAKEKAASSGVLAMSNQLSTLSTLTNVPRQGNTSLKSAAGSAERNDNDLINQRAQGGSGGVATTEVAKQESQQLQDRDTTKLASASVEEQEAAEAARNKLRTSEEIRLIFDQHKNAFYALYKRALRSNLGLQGRVVFNLTILADGSVSEVAIISSELNEADLEGKLVARIKLINFGAKNVATWDAEYYIDFSPAG